MITVKDLKKGHTFVDPHGNRYEFDRVNDFQVICKLRGQGTSYYIVHTDNFYAYLAGAGIYKGWTLEGCGPLTKDTIGHVLIRHMRELRK